jgi:2-polyprenyl-3-methyl-5-hydroxy-6-metoxy-1,4-benzoquinol methylase
MRKWEYGLALKFLLEIGAETVLDVGGGGSLLAPILAHHGMHVTQIDPDPSGESTVAKQNEILKQSNEFICEDFLKYNGRKKFDAVLCMSTIEHIKTENEKAFFAKLLKPAPYLFLTTDYSPKGKTFSVDHERTYNATALRRLAKLAKGWDFYGAVEYRYVEPLVYDYTFATLALYKK